MAYEATDLNRNPDINLNRESNPDMTQPAPYVADLGGVAPKAYTEHPDLGGTGKEREKATYVVRIAGPSEFYDSITDSGAYNGKSFKIPVTVEQAAPPQAMGRIGVTYQIRITGFEKHDNPREPEKSTHQRAGRQLRELIAAVSGYAEQQLDASPGAWQQLQHAFMSQQMIGRLFIVVCTDSMNKPRTNPYIRHQFSAMPATAT